MFEDKQKLLSGIFIPKRPWFETELQAHCLKIEKDIPRS